MPYADLAAAKHLLELDDDASDDAAAIARLVELDVAMSRALELKLWQPDGRKFGGTATPVVRSIPGAGTYPITGWWPSYEPRPLHWSLNATHRLALPLPVYSVTTVAITGPNAETLDAADWALRVATGNGLYRELWRLDGQGFPLDDATAGVDVTADWIGQTPGGTVPQEIVDAVTFLTVEHYRLEQTNPAGAVDQEGRVFRARNPWNFEIVKGAIAAYRVDPLPVL